MAPFSDRPATPWERVASITWGSVEGAVLARWLLAPSTRNRRLARGFGAQWEDYEQRRKFEQHAGFPVGPRGTRLTLTRASVADRLR